MDAQPEQTKIALLALKDCILKVVPNASELFNYNIPVYALVEGGKWEQQIMIAAYKKHVGFYAHPTTIEYFKEPFKVYKKGKGSVQFSLNKPLPIYLIKSMIRYRLRMLSV